MHIYLHLWYNIKRSTLFLILVSHLLHSFNPCPFFGKARFLCTEVKFFIYVYENHLCFIPWKYAYTLSKHKIYPLQQLKVCFTNSVEGKWPWFNWLVYCLLWVRIRFGFLVMFTESNFCNKCLYPNFKLFNFLAYILLPSK